MAMTMTTDTAQYWAHSNIRFPLFIFFYSGGKLFELRIFNFRHFFYDLLISFQDMYDWHKILVLLIWQTITYSSKTLIFMKEDI